MVTSGLHDSSISTAQNHPLLATSAVPLAALYPLPRWAPPKYIKSEGAHEIEDEPEPSQGDPARKEYLDMQTLCRKVLGMSIWISNAYVQMAEITNLLCGKMHSPTRDTLKFTRHMLLHMQAYPRFNTYGGWNVVGLETPPTRVPPYTAGQKDMSFHYFSDANVGSPAVSGGVGMLAGGPIIVESQRQHLKAPNSHTTEVVSAAWWQSQLRHSNWNGVLQELRIRCGVPTAYYLDSATTLFVAADDAAAKKSAWLIRRVELLRDSVGHNEIEPIHIPLPERKMVADPLTKYVTYEVSLAAAPALHA
jgi:hypothetical protein